MSPGEVARDDRRVATVSLNLAGWSSSDLAAALEREYGILTRSGLHCAPLAHRRLGTLPDGSARFSFGPANTFDEIGEAARALRELALAGQNRRPPKSGVRRRSYWSSAPTP